MTLSMGKRAIFTTKRCEPIDERKHVEMRSGNERENEEEKKTGNRHNERKGKARGGEGGKERS